MTDVDNKELEKYEKIGNLTYKLDNYSGTVFTISLFSFLMLGMYLFIYFFGKRTPDNIEDYATTIPLILTTLTLITFGLMSVSAILQWSGMGYKRFKKYNINQIVKLYFYELAENPERKRKWEILKHLTYNLRRLKDQGKSNFSLVTPYNWKLYHKIGVNCRKFNLNTINRVTDFIEDSTIYLDRYQTPQLLKHLGDCFEKENYRGIAKKLNESKDIFQKIDELKDENVKIRSKERIERVKKSIEWISIHGRNLIWIALIIILLILYFTGVLSVPPGP